MDRFEGDFKSVEIWQNGDRNTGTKVIDYNFQSLSNVISNAASVTSANLWDGNSVMVDGESSIIDSETFRLLSTIGSLTSAFVVSTTLGQDVLISITLESGSIDNVIAGSNTTEYTGWENVRDTNNQPIPNKYQVLMHRTSSNNILFRNNGAC